MKILIIRAKKGAISVIIDMAMATYCGVFVSDLENDVRDDGDRDSYSDEILSGHSSDEGTSEQEREITVVPPSPRPSARFYGKELLLKRRLNFTSSQSDDTLDKLPRGFSSFANIPPLTRVTSRSAEPPCKKTKAAEDNRATSLSSGRASNTARRSSSVSTGKDHTDRTKSTPSGRPNAAQRSSGVSTDKDRSGRAKSVSSSAMSEESPSSNTEGTPNQSTQQHLMTILSEVRRTNSRLDDFETRLQSVEQTTSSGCSSSAARRPKVPPYIRVRVTVNLC